MPRGASHRTCGGPPETEIFFSLPPAKKPIMRAGRRPERIARALGPLKWHRFEGVELAQPQHGFTVALRGERYVVPVRRQRQNS